MTRFIARTLCILFAALWAAPLGLAAPFAIAGSGSNIPVTQKLLDAYAKAEEGRILIPPSIGTAGAIKAAQAGKLAIGLTSRALKQEERDSGLAEIRYARIGVVIGAHPGVPDADIGAESLVAIFEGTKTAWSNGKTIIVLARESGDSSNQVLVDMIPGFKRVLDEALAKKRWDILYTDAEEAEAIRSTMGSIGLTDTTVLWAYGKDIKALSFKGVPPTLAHIRDGSYPFFKDLYFVFKPPLSDEARRFADFALSGAGIAVLEANGALRPPPGK